MLQSFDLKLKESDPTFQKALKRSKTGAQGHIGTHLDCYIKSPEKSNYKVDAFIVDCMQAMPSFEECQKLPSLQGKALILHTGNEEKNGYANDAYHATKTFPTDEALNEILAHKPAFIILDSHGIGESGVIHTGRDKLCEAHNCHVIENTNLAGIPKQGTWIHIFIEIELDNPSTGKPCHITWEKDQI